MRVETVIYVYVAVCISMIFFNIACIFIYSHNDKKVAECNIDFSDKINHCIENKNVDRNHRNYLAKQLLKANNLIGFDKALEKLYQEKPEELKWYIKEISSVFVYLTPKYLNKDKLQAAYFPYIIKKYKIANGENTNTIKEAMLKLTHESSLYCRENALSALIAMGDENYVVEALHIIDKSGYYHHSKLIYDALLEFSADKEKLENLLWKHYFTFSLKMQMTVLDYFRFSSDKYCKEFLQLLTSPNCDDEIAYRCIRYFGKYHYEPAYPYLLDFVENSDDVAWQYKSISATALATYPCQKTIEVLKSLLSNKNWYVRFNASSSLVKLGLDYNDLIDVLEGSDRYAAEMMRYRLNQNWLENKGAENI